MIPVYKNYAPSLYGPTVPVEVRRNVATNPRMLSAVSLPLNNFPAANTLTKSAPLPVPHPQGIVTGAKSVSDGSSAELLSVYGVDNLTAAGSPERILGVWVLVTEPGYRIDSFVGWAAQELTANTWTYVTQATHLSADSWGSFQVSRIAGMASTTAACYITGCVAAAGTVPPSQFFDGGSGIVIIDGQPYDTFWAGTPGSSPSLAILSEGGFSGSIYDTLYVFSTVSNSWVRWQTPAVRGQRPVTLARSIDKPSAEAYTMRVSRRIFDEVRDLYTTPY